jgi:hypothetical protein
MALLLRSGEVTHPCRTRRWAMTMVRNVELVSLVLVQRPLFAFFAALLPVDKVIPHALP